MKVSQFLGILIMLVSMICSLNQGKEMAMSETFVPDDMSLAAEFIADKAATGCVENDDIASLRIRLGAFFYPVIEGVTERGETILIWNALEDESWNYSILDRAWSAHCGERTYYEDYQALVKQKLLENCCPPCTFIAPDGLEGRLLEKRKVLWDAIGDRTEISEVLAAVSPAWDFSYEIYESMLFWEAGVFGEEDVKFQISWRYQEVDEESDEFYVLEISFTYPVDDENRQFYEYDYTDESISLYDAIRETKSYQWAVGKKPYRIWVTVEHT